MSKRGLAALYQALSSSESPHLGDEMLARIADATLAGEDIETLFAVQLAHLESCERCAGEYSQLMELLESAVQELAESAEAISLQEAPLLEAPLAEAPALWRQALTTIIEQIDESIRLTFTPSQAVQIREPFPLYGDKYDWRLTTKNLPGQPPRHLTATLSAQSKESCRLTIQLTRDDNRPETAVQIEITYGDTSHTAGPNSHGITRFDDLPISAVPTLTITITPTKN